MQIMEQNRREIRNRTESRIAQLLQATSHEDEGSDEDSDEEDNTSSISIQSALSSRLLVHSSRLTFTRCRYSSTLRICFCTKNEEDRNLEAVGQKVAKDFGEQGVFFGSIIGVEYDSDDEGKEKPFYVVQYTDGVKEDLNEEEYGYVHELCFQMELDAADEVDVDSASDGEESYRPSPKVQ